MRIVRLSDCSIVRMGGTVRLGFTMIEMLLATMLVGVLTTLSILTFQAGTPGWQASTE